VSPARFAPPFIPDGALRSFSPSGQYHNVIQFNNTFFREVYREAGRLSYIPAVRFQKKSPLFVSPVLGAAGGDVVQLHGRLRGRGPGPDRAGGRPLRGAPGSASIVLPPGVLYEPGVMVE